MSADLEAILDADEEGRARIEAFERQSSAHLKDVRIDAERQRAEASEANRRALEDEIQKIVAEADRETANRRARRSAYLAEKEARAQALLSPAAELYARIIVGAPADSSPP